MPMAAIIVAIHTRTPSRYNQFGGTSPILFDLPQFAQFGTGGKEVIEPPLRFDTSIGEYDNPICATQSDTAVGYGDDGNIRR